MKIYLDNAATTKARKEVVKEMQKYFTEEYGNSSSLHEMGERAKSAVNKARTVFSRELNCKPQEIIFTSGGTESNNLAIQGIAKAAKKKTILISSIEHPSVFEVCKYLEKWGYKIIRIPCDSEGIIDIGFLKKELERNKDIFLVSVMHVNNIIGTVNEIDEIVKMCKEDKVIFHTDAVQSFGKLKIDTKNIDLLSASAHKIGGPKGIGLLYVRDGVKLEPLVFGGGQERGLRSGTENVPGIMGFAKALELQRKVKIEKIKKLREKLIPELEKIGGKINGSREKRIYNNIHVSFKGIEGEYLVTYLSKRGIYVSAGSACDSNREKEDHVLKAIGLNESESGESIRISLNEDINEKDIKFVVKEISSTVKKLKINI